MDKTRKIKEIIEILSELSEKDKISIYELLEHDEWGIALEHLCAIICEENIFLPNLVFQRIKEVAEHMEIWHDISEIIKDGTS